MLGGVLGHCSRLSGWGLRSEVKGIGLIGVESCVYTRGVERLAASVWFTSHSLAVTVKHGNFRVRAACV